MMVRSFDRRIESLFEITDDLLKKQLINLLSYNQKDNVNAYQMHEDGTYTRLVPTEGEKPFNVHKEFFYVTKEIVEKARAL